MTAKITKQRVNKPPKKEIKMNHKEVLNQKKKAEKEEKGNKEQTGQIENKEDDRLKSEPINKHINCK